MFEDLISKRKKPAWVLHDDKIICCVTCLHGISTGTCALKRLNECFYDGKEKSFKDFVRYNVNVKYSLWKYRY